MWKMQIVSIITSELNNHSKKYEENCRFKSCEFESICRMGRPCKPEIRPARISKSRAALKRQWLLQSHADDSSSEVDPCRGRVGERWKTSEGGGEGGFIGKDRGRGTESEGAKIEPSFSFAWVRKARPTRAPAPTRHVQLQPGAPTPTGPQPQPGLWWTP